MCDYCAKLAAVENTEMLWRDVLHGGAAPEIWCVLTTRSATLDMSEFYASRRQVLLALRRRWPATEIAWFLEYTTGYTARSRGLRHPHWNGFIKGVPGSELAEADEVIKRVWCARADALPQAQIVKRVEEMRGLTRYVAMHFQKSSQKPPAGFRGHRFTSTRGYYAGGRMAAREAAREALRWDRAFHRAMVRGAGDVEAGAVADDVMAIAAATDWELGRVDVKGRWLGPVAHRTDEPVELEPLSEPRPGPPAPDLSAIRAERAREAEKRLQLDELRRQRDEREGVKNDDRDDLFGWRGDPRGCPPGGYDGVARGGGDDGQGVGSATGQHVLDGGG